MNTENTKKSSVKILFRIAGFLKPFKKLLLLQILLNTIFSILSALTVVLIKPILELIFYGNSNKEKIVTSNDIFKNLNDSFFQFIYSIINSASTIDTLLNVSFLIISVFILKNIFKYLGAVVSSKLEEGIIKSIRDTIFAKITSLSVDFFPEVNRQFNINYN